MKINHQFFNNRFPVPDFDNQALVRQALHGVNGYRVSNFLIVAPYSPLFDSIQIPGLVR